MAKQPVKEQAHKMTNLIDLDDGHRAPDFAILSKMRCSIFDMLHLRMNAPFDKQRTDAARRRFAQSTSAATSSVTMISATLTQHCAAELRCARLLRHCLAQIPDPLAFAS
jgi:hypothetical protein